MNRKVIVTTAATLLWINIASGCGTILYPERKGQIDGKIDAGVAVLDAIGLLFFLIPGVIAFAVDFSNGTIYLPGGKGAIHLNTQELETISRNGKIDYQGLSTVLSGYLKSPIQLSAGTTQTQAMPAAQALLLLQKDTPYKG